MLQILLICMKVDVFSVGLINLLDLNGFNFLFEGYYRSRPLFANVWSLFSLQNITKIMILYIYIFKCAMKLPATFVQLVPVF